MMKRANIAFVLRLWRENTQAKWRASLVNARTTEQIHFSRLIELVSFLENRTGEIIIPVDESGSDLNLPGGDQSGSASEPAGCPLDSAE